MSWWSRSRLGTRIFVAFSALLLAALVATLGVVQFVVSREAERTLHHELATTGQIFDRLVRERAARLRTNATLLARDFALKRIIATYFDPATFDPATLASAALSYQGRLGVELLWIVDDAGELLVSLPREPLDGRSQAGFPPVREAIDTGTGSTAIAASDGRLYQLVAVPVFAPDVIAYLVLGQAIDDAFATQLKEATGSDISFLTTDQVFASSWPRSSRDFALPAPSERLAFFSGQASGEPVLVDVSGERYLSLPVVVNANLPQPLHALVQGSYDQALTPLRALQRRIATIGAFALLLALAIGVAIARGITSPLQTLVDGMREVVRGNLDYRTRIKREDEVGFLAKSFNDMVDGLQEREIIKETFGRFVSRDVAEAVLLGDMPLGGEYREVSILFQDIRGFTKLSERLDPAATLALLNRFFTAVVAAVEAQGGVVKQFTGDGVMALFGAPQALPDHAERAVRAALGIVDRLADLNVELAEQSLPPIVIGVGIDSGEVVAGLIGPDSRVEYGVVGAAVNLANRVESLTKELDATVLVTQGIADRLGSAYLRGRQAALPVKGRREPLEVVEILGIRSPVPVEPLLRPVPASPVMSD
jgi:adenylate cyclase